MFQNKKNLFLLIASTILTTTAQAGLFQITPNIGYRNLTLKATDILNNSSETESNNLFYGLKLGLMSGSGINFDIAGSLSSGKAKSTLSGFETEQDLNHKIISASLGVTAMNTFKIFLGYIFIDELTIKTPSVPLSQIELTGPGFLVGVGVHMTQSISATLQYDVHQFNQVKLESVGQFQDIKTAYEKLDTQSISLGLGMTF